MTAPRATRRLAATALSLAVLLVTAACVHYPNVADIGGTRIRPHNGRAVREPDRALFYVDLENTGKFGDTIVAVATPVAREARLVSAGGTTIERLALPGIGQLSLRPGGDYILLTNLTRPLNSGDVIIVTLVFEKVGRLGVVTVVE